MRNRGRIAGREVAQRHFFNSSVDENFHGLRFVGRDKSFVRLKYVSTSVDDKNSFCVNRAAAQQFLSRFSCRFTGVARLRNHFSDTGDFFC